MDSYHPIFSYNMQNMIFGFHKEKISWKVEDQLYPSYSQSFCREPLNYVYHTGKRIKNFNMPDPHQSRSTAAPESTSMQQWWGSEYTHDYLKDWKTYAGAAADGGEEFFREYQAFKGDVDYSQARRNAVVEFDIDKHNITAKRSTYSRLQNCKNKVVRWFKHNTWAAGCTIAGLAIGVYSVGLGIYEDFFEKDCEKTGENTITALVEEGGSAIGVKLGSEIGGFVGNFIAPGIGGLVGAAAGAAIGAITGGYIAGLLSTLFFSVLKG